MLREYFFVLIILLFLSSCRECPEKVPPFTEQIFTGRGETISYGQKVRRPVYQAKVPLVWRRIDPSPDDPLSDTTKPIVKFSLDENVTLSVHTFPTSSLEERIPLTAQVERWRSQLKGAPCMLDRVGHDGFAGLYFEGKNETTTVCAWCLQLDFAHYQKLHFMAATLEEEEHYKQMSADYTIKVSGPTALIEKHKKEILLFAGSFELIDEIPND